MFRFLSVAGAAVAFCLFATASQARVTPDSLSGIDNVSPTGYAKKSKERTTARRNADPEIKIEPRRKVGYVIELLVQCPPRTQGPRATGIITFSMLDKQFCQPNQRCHGTAVSAAAHVCKATKLRSTHNQ